MRTYITITFPVLLRGCETLSLTLEKEERLRVFENRGVPRNISGTCWVKILGDWTKLHNEKLHDLYTSPMVILAIISRRMR
jgi:hypothetical protein